MDADRARGGEKARKSVVRATGFLGLPLPRQRNNERRPSTPFAIIMRLLQPGRVRDDLRRRRLTGGCDPADHHIARNVGSRYAGPWRQYLLRYNAERTDNPDGLHQAIDLYRNPAYASLRDAFGAENLLVLSAGWGLVRGNFLLPQYEITLSQAGRATGYNSRALHPDFDDLVQLPKTDSGRLCTIGGKDYLPLFLQLTRGYAGPRAIYYNSDTPPTAPGCALIRYPSDTRTNWHYALARELADGRDVAGLSSKTVPRGLADRKVRKPTSLGASAGPHAGAVSRKYAPLHRHLMEQGEGTKSVTLTFAQIAEILGQALPASARNHAPVWWANGGHPQAEAWLRAGYRKAAHHLGKDAKTSWVRFERTSRNCPA